MATIPIPMLSRGQPRRVNGAMPQMQAPGMGGVLDLARGFGQAAEALDAAEVRRQRELEQRALEVDREEAELEKARNIERASQLRLEWTEQLQRRKTEAPEGADGFTPTVLKDFDASRDKVLDQIPAERERRELRAMLGSVRGHLQTDALGFELTARRNYRMRVLGEATEQDAKAVTLSPQQFPDVLAQRVAAIAGSLDLDVESKAKLIEQARERLAIQAGLALIDRPGGPEDFLARTGVAGGKAGKGGKLVQVAGAGAPGLADPVIAALSDTGLRQLIDRATTFKVQRDSLAAAEQERRVRMAEIAAARRDRLATQAWTLLDGFIKDGLAPDMSDPANAKAVQALQGTPFAAAYRTRMAELPKRAAAALQPLATQREQLAALRVQAEKQGTSKQLQEEIERRQQVLSAAESAFAKDPLRATVERFPQAAPAPLDTASPDAIEAGIAARAPLVETAKAFANAPRVSPLFDSEVPAVKAAIDSLPPKERAGYVARLARAAGPRGAVALAEQLDKNDRALALAFKAGADATQDGQYRSEFILRGARALEDKQVLKDSAAISGWQALVAKEVDRLRLPDARVTEDMKAAAGYMVAALAAEKGGAAGRREIERAVQLALGGTIVEQGGAAIVLPDGTTQNQLAQRLRSVTTEELRPQLSSQPHLPMFVRAGGAHIPVQQFIETLPGAQLVTVGQGAYSVVVDGRYVTNEEGRRIVIALNP